MKLTELFNDIIEQKINEISYNDLSSIGTSIKQGITNLGNKKMNVDFSGTKKTGVNRANLAADRITDLAREVGFEVPQADRFTLLNEKFLIKPLGPFSSAQSIPNFNYLQVEPKDMNTLESIKKYFGNNFVRDSNTNSITIKNFKKYKTSNGEYVFIYDKNSKGLIIYYSKKNVTTFYLSTSLDPTLGGSDLLENDKTLLTKLLKIDEKEDIDEKEFKKLNITIIATR